MSSQEITLKFRGDAAQLQSVFAQVRREINQTAQVQHAAGKSELTLKQQLAAAASLDKQRMAAALVEFKKHERALEAQAKAAAKAAAGIRPFSQEVAALAGAMKLLSSTTSALQGPMGGVASRISALTPMLQALTGAVTKQTGASHQLTGATAQVAAAQAEAGTGVAAYAAQLVGAAGPIGIAILGAVALAGASVLVGKELFETTRAAAEFQGKLFDLSQQTGVSVETLSTLEYAARKTGSNLDSITSSLVLFQTKLEDAQDPASQTAARFRNLGITVTDTEDTLRQALGALAAMPEGFHQTNEAAELFGRRGAKQVLAILKETNGDIDSLTQRLRDANALITGESARAADEFNDTLLLVELQIRGLTATIGNELMPEFLNAVKQVSESLKDNQDAIRALAQFLGAVIKPAILVLTGVIIAANFQLKVLLATAKATPVGWLLFRESTNAAAQASEAFAASTDKATEALRNLHAQQLRGTSVDAGGGEYVSPGSTVPRDFAEEAAKRLVDLQQIETEAIRAATEAKAQFNAAIAAGTKPAADAIANEIANIRKVSAATTNRLKEEAVAQQTRLDSIKQNGEKEVGETEKVSQKLRDIQNKIADEGTARKTKILALETAAAEKHNANLIQKATALRDANVAAFKVEIEIREQAALAGGMSRERAFEETKAINELIFDAERDLIDRKIKIEGEHGEKVEALRTDRAKNEQARSKKQRDETTAFTAASEKAALAVERRGLEVREQQRLTAETRLRLLVEVNLALESSALRAQLVSLKTNWEERKKLLQLEADATTTTADRKLEIQTELQIRDEEYTRTFLDLSRQRIDAINRENAIQAPDQGPLGDDRDRIIHEALAKVNAEAAPAGRPGSQSAIDQLFGSINAHLTGNEQAAALAGLQTMTLAFGELGHALGSAASAWVLYGNAGTNLRKMTAEVLAAITQQAVIKSIWEFAEGLAALALAYFGWPNAGPSAGMHFAASAMYAGIAGVAGISGRVIAGNSFAQASGSGGGASGGTGGRSGSGSGGSSAPQSVDVGRRNAQAGSGLPPIQVNVTVVGQATDGFKYMVEKATVQSYRDGGAVREIIGHAMGQPGFKG